MAALLLFGFGDGAARGIQAIRGWQSPYTILFPVVLISVAIIAVDRGRIPRRLAMHLVAFLTFAALLLVLQVNFFHVVNLNGFLQLILFVIFLLAIADLFSDASDALAEVFRRGVLISHYLLASYILLVYVVWLVAGHDASITAVITGAETPLNDYYGFRPAGLSTEPQWAAFALAASYTSIYLLAPREAARAFVALVAAMVMVRSGTSFLFIGFLLVVPIVEQRHRFQRGRFFLLALAGALVLLALFGERAVSVLGGGDGSTLMRLNSAEVAWGVIVGSLPWGVGYGNFQQHALYGGSLAEFAASARFYKSDVFLMNLLAELGLAGAVLYAWIAAVFGRARHPLVWAYIAGLTLLAGTLLIPSVAVVAAAAGLHERQRRVERQAGRLLRPDAAVAHEAS